MKTMKYINKVSALALVSALAFTSCDDLFEPALENVHDLDYMAVDANFAAGVLGNAYRLMPYSIAPASDFATDDAVTNESSSSYLKMATGGWTSQMDPMSQWKDRFNAIEYINIFLEHVDEVHFAENENRQVLFNHIFKGDAYGMRAIQLFYALRAHAGLTSDGEMLGVPVLTKFIDASSDCNIPRNTLKECIAQIMNDIDSAMVYLPAEYKDITKFSELSDEDYNKLVKKLAEKSSNAADPSDYTAAYGKHMMGKVCGNILKAFRAQVALWAASPAYADYSGVTMADAAKYAADVIGDKKVVADALKFWMLDAGSLESGVNGPESIWQTNVEDHLDRESDFFPPSADGKGRCNPTQNLVDAFYTTDGYPITDSRSCYDPSNPYANRDGRLAAYVVVNGDKIGGKTINTTTNVSGNIDGLNHTAEYSTRTGYYLKKNLHPDVNVTNGTKQKAYDIRIRWTELFLVFAEAANEAVGPNASVSGSSQTAYDIVKQLRERAGICVGAQDPYLDECAKSKEKMRELIRNERRLELCFENHRFYDLRRWKANLNETATGMKIGDGTYEKIDVEKREYKDFMYYGPIPYSEIMKYNALKQNQGW